MADNVKNKSTASYLMFISAMLIFGTIGIFRRYIPLSSGLLACARGYLGALVLILFLAFRKQNVFGGMTSRKDLVLLILSGIAMGFNWILLFEAYNYTSVATATLCYYMEPTIVILAAPFLLKEKLTLKKAVCAVISVIGMVFVSGITMGEKAPQGNLQGVLLGLGAAMLYACVVLTNKKISEENAYKKTTIQLLSAATCLVPYLLLTEDVTGIVFNPLSIVMLLIVGVIHTGICYAMYFSSMRHLKAQSIAVMSYIDPVSALLLSALILGEKMTPVGLLGAVMIIGAAFVSEWHRKEK